MRGGQAPKVVKQLRDDLRNVLRRAYDQGALPTPIHLIEKHVVVAGAPADITRDVYEAMGPRVAWADWCLRARSVRGFCGMTPQRLSNDA